MRAQHPTDIARTWACVNCQTSAHVTALGHVVIEQSAKVDRTDVSSVILFVHDIDALIAALQQIRPAAVALEARHAAAAQT